MSRRMRAGDNTGIFSPFREEKTPSFKVNDRLNEWYDFGAATGATSWNWESTCTERTV